MRARIHTQLRGVSRVEFDIRLRHTALEDRRTLRQFITAEQMVVRRNTPLTVLRFKARRNRSEVIQTGRRGFDKPHARIAVAQ